MNFHARTRAPAAPALLFALALVGTACSACGGDDADPASTMIPGCTAGPTTPVTLEGKQAIFDLGDTAVAVAATTEEGYIVINAKSDGDIDDLLIAFQDIVTEAGFDISGSESEGDEGEVFFAKGDVAAGQVRLNESDCEGYVDVKISVLDDPSVLPTTD